MNTILCAVDPGKEGGIAWLEPGKGVQAVKRPDTDEGTLLIALRVHRLRESPGLLRVYIEEVGGYVKPSKLEQDENGNLALKGGQPGSAMFNFGDNAGVVRGMFLALGAEIVMVRPQVWQGMFFDKKGRRETAEWKRILKGHAQRFFPGLKVTLATADALCILRHAMNLANLPSVKVSGAVPDEKAREGGTAAVIDAFREVEAEEKANNRLRLGDWKGTPWVFEITASGRVVLLRAAKGADMALPKFSRDEERKLNRAL